MSDPNGQHISLLGSGKGGFNSQPGLPKSFPLDVENDNGEPGLETPAGKNMLLETKRKALTEEVFVEQAMLKAPESFEKLYELVTGKAPASLFRLVNVDQSWIEAINEHVNDVERMQKLFDVFREYGMTFKVKVIFCMKKLWETRVFENFLTQVLERSTSDIKAVMDLYHIAVILSYEVPNMTSGPADIFPYGATAQHWVTTHYGAPTESCVRSVMCSYYIRIVHNIFTMNNVSNMHHIKPILSKYNVTHQSRVAEYEGGLARLVDTVMFPMLSSPRAAACALGVFLVVQMLTTKNPKLEQCVRSHDFITPLRQVAATMTYSHTKWACSHMMKLMLSAPNLVEHTLPCYGAWYEDASASGAFDVRHLRFRFPFEYCHAVLREGMEKSAPGSKQGEQWASPIRHAYVLRSLIDGIEDPRSLDRELRSLTMLKLLFQHKWTSKKDMVAMMSTPRFQALPSKVHLTVEGSDRSALSASGSGRIKKKGTFFKTSSRSMRKNLTQSMDSQSGSPLLSCPENILVRILKELALPDLFLACTLCWKVSLLIDNPMHGLWRAAYMRDPSQSFHPMPNPGNSKKEDPLFWKMQCKQMMRGALPHALYRVLLTRHNHGPTNHPHNGMNNNNNNTTPGNPAEDLLAKDAEEATKREIVVTALKLFGTIQRTSLWWPEIEPFVETHWLVLLLEMSHDGSSLEISRSAWRVFYELLANHAGIVDRFIEQGWMERFLRPLDLRAPSVVIFNGLYYLTKLLANDAPTMEHRKRMARKDVQTLAQWLKDNNIWSQWHTIYNAYQSDPRTHSFIFPSIAALFSAVHDSFLCKKLKSHLFKVADYRAAVSAVRDLSRGKTAGSSSPSPMSSSSEEQQHSAPIARAASPSLDKEDEMLNGGNKANASKAKKGAGRKSEKRDVTASGVKVYRDLHRHGCRSIDIEDGVALIRRNSDPGPDLTDDSSSPPTDKRRMSVN